MDTGFSFATSEALKTQTTESMKEELEKVAESYEKGEHKYPLGLTMAEVAKVEF